MRELRLSRRTDADLAGIADFTIATFGTSQARKYRDQSRACFTSICGNPLLGRSAEELAPGLRRIRQQAHVVFYIADADHVLIVRVLHHKMDFESHL